MKVEINVNLSDDRGGSMYFRQDGKIRAESFEEIAKVLSAFHELFERLTRELKPRQGDLR